MNTEQKVLMADELVANLERDGMTCKVIPVTVRNYQHLHMEVLSGSNVLAEIIDEGHSCFKLRFFEDLNCHETLCSLAKYIDALESKFDSRIGFLSETKNCYRIWIEE